MKVFVDSAGRFFIPKLLRDQLGLQPGAVEVTADGAALRVVPISEAGVKQREGRVVIPKSGAVLTDEMVRDAIEAGRR